MDSTTEQTNTQPVNTRLWGGSPVLDADLFDFIVDARRFGFEDGSAGIGRRGSVYFLIGGEAYNAYDDGHKCGQCYARTYAGTLPHLSRPEPMLPDLPVPPAVAEWLQARVLAEVKRMSAFDDNAPHRKYAEGCDMDADLEAIRSGEMPIAQMTDELLEQIENAIF